MLATWSMVADCVDNQEVKTGRRDEASVYATYSLVRKIAQGVGGAIVSLILGAVGYKALEGWTKEQITIHNSQFEIANGIRFVSVLLPLIGFALVFIVLLLMYNLNKKDVENNTAILRVKHQQALGVTPENDTFLVNPENDLNEDKSFLDSVEGPKTILVPPKDDERLTTEEIKSIIDDKLEK